MIKPTIINMKPTIMTQPIKPTIIAHPSTIKPSPIIAKSPIVPTTIIPTKNHKVVGPTVLGDQSDFQNITDIIRNHLQKINQQDKYDIIVDIVTKNINMKNIHKLGDQYVDLTTTMITDRIKQIQTLCSSNEYGYVVKFQTIINQLIDYFKPRLFKKSFSSMWNSSSDQVTQLKPILMRFIDVLNLSIESFNDILKKGKINAINIDDTLIALEVLRFVSDSETHMIIDTKIYNLTSSFTLLQDHVNLTILEIDYCKMSVDMIMNMINIKWPNIVNTASMYMIANSDHTKKLIVNEATSISLQLGSVLKYN